MCDFIDEGKGVRIYNAASANGSRGKLSLPGGVPHTVAGKAGNNSRRSEQMDIDQNCPAACHGQGCQHCFTNAPLPQPNDVDLFSEDALQLAEALHKQYPNTWDVLYHKGLMPELIAFIKADRQKALQRANRTLRLAALKQKGEMAKAVTAARIDPFDFVGPCEPECSSERHAYHQGQWDMATRIKEFTNQEETE